MNPHTAGAPKPKGLPIDLKPGQSIQFGELTLVPVEFGTSYVKLLARHSAHKLARKRPDRCHILTISGERSS